MRQDSITSIEIDDYIERCEILLNHFTEISERAEHVAFMNPKQKKEISGTIKYLDQMIQEASDIDDDLRLISYGTIEVPDYAVREYFNRIEDLEYDCDCVRQDVIDAAKEVLRIVK